MKWVSRSGSMVRIAVLFLAGAVPLVAQDTAGDTTSASARASGRGPAGPVVAVERDGPVRIDGRLDEAAWERAPRVTTFVQGEPSEGAAPGERTTVRILFDDEAIYVGARMEERAGPVVGQLVRRDDTGQSDYFEVSFDPNRDRRSGYLFRVNAAGVQRDAYLHDDNREDDSWDAVWESRVTVEDGGWTVEMRIPWSQIRYEPSAAGRAWGVNFVRWRLDAGERLYHSLVPRNQHGRVSFFGVLEGMRPPADLRRIELRPYVLARARTGPAEDADPFFDGRDGTVRGGLDLRYGLGSAFTLDATFNPDFGQVEADPAVINLTAFETRFSERRPFFVEDARIFDFSLSGFGNQLFYSRRIGRSPQGRLPAGAAYVDVPDQSTILGAGKLTGRTAGGLSLGVLAAVTAAEEARAFFPGGAGPDSVAVYLAEPRSQYGVVRARQDLREGSTTVGGILTAVRRGLPADGSFDFLPSNAYSGGIDWEHMWGERSWAFTGFVAKTLVAGDTAALTSIQRSSNHYFQRPDSDREVDTTLTRLTGLDWSAGIERRSGEHWTGGVFLRQTTPGFEINDLGFSQNSEQVGLSADLTYREIEPGPLFRDYRVNLSTFQNWRGSVLRDPFAGAAWTDAHKQGSIWIDGRGTLNNFWDASFEVAYRPRVLDDAATRGGPLMVSPANYQVEGGLSTDRRQPLNFELEAEYEWGRAFRSWAVGIETTWRPDPRLELELEPQYSASTTSDQYVATFDDAGFQPTYGRRYLFGELDRRSLSLETRVNVTFTPGLTLQFYAQPLLEAGRFVGYRQLARASSFEFIDFERGIADGGAPGEPPAGCVGGRICERDGVQYVDFDGDGGIDASFGDRDFNVVSLIGNAVLRWEYRPGSTVFLVWQQRRFDQRPFGDFDARRDPGDLLALPPENVLMLKVNYWLGL